MTQIAMPRLRVTTNNKVIRKEKEEVNVRVNVEVNVRVNMGVRMLVCCVIATLTGVSDRKTRNGHGSSRVNLISIKICYSLLSSTWSAFVFEPVSGRLSDPSNLCMTLFGRISM